MTKNGCFGKFFCLSSKCFVTRNLRLLPLEAICPTVFLKYIYFVSYLINNVIILSWAESVNFSQTPRMQAEQHKKEQHLAFNAADVLTMFRSSLPIKTTWSWQARSKQRPKSSFMFHAFCTGWNPRVSKTANQQILKCFTVQMHTWSKKKRYHTEVQRFFSLILPAARGECVLCISSSIFNLVAHL